MIFCAIFMSLGYGGMIISEELSKYSLVRSLYETKLLVLSSDILLLFAGDIVSGEESPKRLRLSRIVMKYRVFIIE